MRRKQVQWLEIGSGCGFPRSRAQFEAPENAKFPVFFPVSKGKCPGKKGEQGSRVTASTAIQSTASGAVLRSVENVPRFQTYAPHLPRSFSRNSGQQREHN